MRRLLAVCAVAALLPQSACGSSKEQAAAATPASAPAPSPSAAGDGQGKRACTLNQAPSKDADTKRLMDPGVVEGIYDATKGSTTPGLRAAGQKLLDRHGEAITAHGTDGETAALVRLFTASVELDTLCTTTRLD